MNYSQIGCFYDWEFLKCLFIFRIYMKCWFILVLHYYVYQNRWLGCDYNLWLYILNIYGCIFWIFQYLYEFFCIIFWIFLDFNFVLIVPEEFSIIFVSEMKTWKIFFALNNRVLFPSNSHERELIFSFRKRLHHCSHNYTF